MMNRVRNLLARLHNDTSGAMSVEKIMIITIIALPIIIAMISFRDKLLGWLTDQSSRLNDTTVATP